MRLRFCRRLPEEHVQAVETVRQLRSRFAQRFKYRSVRLASSLAAALLDGLFKQPCCIRVVCGLR